MILYVFNIFLVSLISVKAEVKHLLFFFNDNEINIFHQEKIKVFSNYDDGLLSWGKEEMVTNYMELSEDPKGGWIRLSSFNSSRKRLDPISLL